MKKSFRFLSIAALNIMVATNAVYAHNSPALSSGEAQLKAGQYQEAIENFTKAIESSPKLGSDDMSKAYYNRAVSELAFGATESAKADFMKSIAADPTPVGAQGFKIRALAKTALGDIKGAQSDFKRAGVSGESAGEQEVSRNNG